MFQKAPRFICADGGKSITYLDNIFNHNLLHIAGNF